MSLAIKHELLNPSAP